MPGTKANQCIASQYISPFPSPFFSLPPFLSFPPLLLLSSSVLSPSLPTHQISNHLLQVYSTFLYVLFRSPQSNDVLLLAGLREGDLNSVETIPNLANLLSLRSDDLLVETLVDENVLRTLVLLEMQYM